MPDFQVIPSIDELRRRPSVRALESRFGASAVVDALRAAAGDVRRAIADGTTAAADEDAASALIERGAAGVLDAAFERSLEPVINATGVIIHTNIGRAPLAAPAIERIGDIARGYASIEYDLGRGARGRRDVHAEQLLRR